MLRSNCCAVGLLGARLVATSPLLAAALDEEGAAAFSVLSSLLSSSSSAARPSSSAFCSNALRTKSEVSATSAGERPNCVRSRDPSRSATCSEVNQGKQNSDEHPYRCHLNTRTVVVLQRTNRSLPRCVRELLPQRRFERACKAGAEIWLG